MTEDVRLQLRAARARMQYWLKERENARLIGDTDVASRADTFVKEYEDFIAKLERRGPDNS